MRAKPSCFIPASRPQDTGRRWRRRRSSVAIAIALMLLGLVTPGCSTVDPPSARPAERPEDRRDFELLEKLARERRAERPAAAAAALEFLSMHPGPITGDEVHAEARGHLEALTASRTIGFRVTGPDRTPRPFVLATMTGETGTPVRGLYDTRIDLDAEGRGKIEGVPPGVYSLRLHTIREFRSEAGYDLVAVRRLDLTVENASFHSRLRPGGRFSVTIDSPARLVVTDDIGQPVAATVWRGEQGGWTTEFVRLTPAFTSCVLPGGTYRVEAVRYRKVIAGGTVIVVPGITAELRLKLPR